MTEERQPQIQIKNIAKLYGDHHVQALADISLEIYRGEFVALMGASGCGKSTLLNIIGGIDRPTGGQVIFGNSELNKMTDEQLTRLRASKIGFVFQFFNLLSTLTVRENIALPLELLGKENRAAVRKRVDDMLEHVNMSKRADFYPALLSGGELQRTAIARALIHNPELILADEPTGNLDTENGLAILQLLHSINHEQKLTIVMATHSPEAASYAQRIFQIKDGHLVGESTECPDT
ncbi:MAG TPA: ABC transporter ATP-binding protein [Oculatellaceae cyanobacterium]